MRVWYWLIMSFAVCSFNGPAVGQSLSIASSAPVTSIDPHYHTLAPNESLGRPGTSPNAVRPDPK